MAETHAHPAAGEAAPFNVSVAQYFMDTAGFHDLATVLSDTQKIEVSYLSKVTRVSKVLAQTAWPADLQEQGLAFGATLAEFAAALEADNVADAVRLSETVHDAQHELSHAIDHWLGDAGPAAGEAEPFNVSVAQYFMDTAGFHDLATVLSDTQKIEASYVSKVTRVRKVLAQTAWPADLQEQGLAFGAVLGEFAAALEADNVADAVRLSEEVHDAQHEFSHAIDAWLGTASDDH
ncbi:MAG: hypothetical protein KA764_20695 [Anaerolineales bacterium]|nr:hypothetical protein [Anaerolineales bacterium]